MPSPDLCAQADMQKPAFKVETRYLQNNMLHCLG